MWEPLCRPRTLGPCFFYLIQHLYSLPMSKNTWRNQSAFRLEVRRLQSLFTTWQCYLADGAELLAVESEQRFRAFDALLRERISKSNVIHNKKRWFSMLDAIQVVKAEEPPEPPEPEESRKDLHEDRCTTQLFPTWKGPSGSGEEQRITGLVWCRKLQRWAIRLQTRFGTYYNSNIPNIPFEELPWELDFLRWHLRARCFFDVTGYLRKSAWNDYDLWGAALHAPQLDPEVPHHRHLLCWMERIQLRNEQNANSERCGRLPITLHQLRGVVACF